MKVLYLTPFSPVAHHDHAAAFTLAKFIPRLAERVELTVFTPVPAAHGATLNYKLVGPPDTINASFAARWGKKPGWLRQAWPAQINDQVDELISESRPDVIHAEYLQSAEVATRWPRVVLGLRDNTTAVMARSSAHARGVVKAYRVAEYYRTRRFEETASMSASGIVVLSENDQKHFCQYNRRTRLIPPGVELLAESWSEPENGPPTLVFTGAMWRRANAAVAEMLMSEMMPLVWRSRPDARLRVVGASPMAQTIALAEVDERLTVVGHVPDLDVEMLAADAVVVPTLFGGGVMIKVLRAMALGCPTVTNDAGSASVGATDAHVLLGETPSELAERVVEALDDPSAMSVMGGRAREHVSHRFGWDRAISAYLDLYREVAST